MILRVGLDKEMEATLLRNADAADHNVICTTGTLASHANAAEGRADVLGCVRELRCSSRISCYGCFFMGVSRRDRKQLTSAKVARQAQVVSAAVVVTSVSLWIGSVHSLILYAIGMLLFQVALIQSGARSCGCI